MKDSLKGWQSILDGDQLWIPPIEESGFKENVIIRSPIDPVSYEEEEDEKTVLLRNENDDDEKTVLLDEIISFGHIFRKRTGEETKIGRDTFVIGKANNCDLVISNNVTISRCHAQIRKTAGKYFLKDLGSSNHTYVGEKQIQEEVLLEDGMAFRLSDEEFVFRLEMK